MTSILLACVLLVSLGPAAAAQSPGARVAEVRDRLEDARQRVRDVDREVAEARSALALADDELAASTSRLDAVETELRSARAAHLGAQEQSTATVVALQQAELMLQQHSAELVAQHRRFDDHVASTYMYGDTRTGLLSSIEGAGTPQDLANALRYLRSTQDADRTLIDLTAAATARAQQEREAIETLQRQRVRTEQTALDQRRRAEELVRRQFELLGQVQQQQRRRELILAALRKDSAIADELARLLSQQVARLVRRLEAERPRPVVVPLVPAPLAPPSEGVAPAWAALLPEAGRPWASSVAAAASRAGLDPRLLASLVWAESAFQPGASSTVGAVGLSQLMPATAAGLRVNPRDPLQNLDGGARYLAAQLARFKTLDLALAAYNAGPAAVQRHRGVPPYPETQAYVLRVLTHYEQLGRT